MKRDPVSQFFGGLLIAVGILMMVLCGGCGVVFLAGFIVSGFSEPGAFGMAVIPLVVGGVPALFGFGLFKAGRSLRPLRAAAPPFQATLFTDDGRDPP